MPGHCIPTGLADPQRLIFYGGTEPEARAGEKSVTFFAYDLAARKLLWSGFGGPARAMIFSPATGRIWFNEDELNGTNLVCFNPAMPGQPMPVPGAHGGSEADNSAVVQYDTRTRTRKVIAFLHPCYEQKYGVMLRGTYSVALDAKGESLYITWNCSRGTKVWDSCALTVMHIPASERRL